VTGYKQLKVCHMILQQLTQVLSLQTPHQPCPTSLPGQSGTSWLTSDRELGASTATAASASVMTGAGPNPGRQVAPPGGLQAAEEEGGPEVIARGPTCWSTAIAAHGGSCCCCEPLLCEARRFLSDMCRERLMPTYWVNEVGLCMGRGGGVGGEHPARAVQAVSMQPLHVVMTSCAYLVSLPGSGGAGHQPCLPANHVLHS